MTKKTYSPWRTRLAIVATGFALFGAFTVAKADAALPQLTVVNGGIAEGNFGTKQLTVVVVLSQKTANYQWAKLTTKTGTAAPAVDYTPIPQVLAEFPPNADQASFKVTIKGDTLDEFNEDFRLEVTEHSAGLGLANTGATMTITDDDAEPSVSVDDITRKEGTGEATPFPFTLKLSAPSAKGVNVKATIVSGTAAVGSDVVSDPVQVQFPPGTTHAAYKTSVVGDAVVEADETFSVQLSNPDNIQIGDDTAVATIVNDDVLVAKPQDSEPAPKPAPKPGNGGGTQGSGGGTVVTTTPDAPDAPTSDNGVAGEGEQALAPNAATEARPAHRSMDWMTAALLTLLGACALGLIVVTFMIAKRRRSA